MFEFAVVLLLKQIPQWKATSKMKIIKRRNQRFSKDKLAGNTKNEYSLGNPTMDTAIGKKEKTANVLLDQGQKSVDCTMDTHKIDIAAIVVFSVLYFLFNCTYWLYV